MALAVAGALVLGQWDEAAAVAFLFSLSEALEALSLDRARRAVRALLEIAPETAERIGPDGHAHRVPASSLDVGQRVRVRAGDRVPVDGRIIAGRSSVDQKMITGESVPVLREVGDEVFAGTINGEGSLDVEATKPPWATASAHRIASPASAKAQKGPEGPRSTASVEKFAAIYTPVVVGLAARCVMIVPPLLLTRRDVADLVRPRVGAPGDRLPVRPGDRHPGRRRQRLGERGPSRNSGQGRPVPRGIRPPPPPGVR